VPVLGEPFTRSPLESYDSGIGIGNKPLNCLHATHKVKKLYSVHRMQQWPLISDFPVDVVEGDDRRRQSYRPTTLATAGAEPSFLIAEFEVFLDMGFGRFGIALKRESAALMHFIGARPSVLSRCCNYRHYISVHNLATLIRAVVVNILARATPYLRSYVATARYHKFANRNAP
jgi:hypothetical protein